MDRSRWYPTGLLQAAATTPGGRLVDAAILGWDWKTTVKSLDGVADVVLGTVPHGLERVAQVARALKRERDDVRIGIIGAPAALLPTDTLRCVPDADWVGRRECEWACRDIGSGAPFDSVEGISHRRDGRLLHNAERMRIRDLDVLPSTGTLHARDLQPHRYRRPHLLHPHVTVSTGREHGIAWPLSGWQGPAKDRHCGYFSPGRIRTEVLTLLRLFPSTREVYFDDNTLAVDDARLLEVAAAVGPLGIPWSFRGDSRLDPGIWSRLRKAGLRSVVIPCGPGGENVRRRLGWEGSPDALRELARQCRRESIRMHGEFPVGFPWESDHTFGETLEWARELAPHTLELVLVVPEPGTWFHEGSLREGWHWSAGSGTGALWRFVRPVNPREAGRLLEDALGPARARPYGRETLADWMALFHREYDGRWCRFRRWGHDWLETWGGWRKWRHAGHPGMMENGGNSLQNGGFR